MNTLIALLGLAIFAAAIYGIVKHNTNRSTQPSGGFGGGGYSGGGELENRPGENPKNEGQQLEK